VWWSTGTEERAEEEEEETNLAGDRREVMIGRGGELRWLSALGERRTPSPRPPVPGLGEEEARGATPRGKEVAKE
jgi:hypothetical protein